MIESTPAPPEQINHFQTLPVALVIPGLQSIVTGFSLGLLVGSAAWALNAPRPLAWGLLSAAAAQAITWLLMLGAWRSVVYAVEHFAQADLNQDGHIGQPRDPIRVEVVQNDGRSIDFIDMPTGQDQLAALGTGLIRGVSFSESNWTGRGAPFSRREFHAVRDIMIKRGLVRWVNGKARAQGMELTPAGRAVMRRFAALAAAPSPTLSDKRTN